MLERTVSVIVVEEKFIFQQKPTKKLNNYILPVSCTNNVDNCVPHESMLHNKDINYVDT